ncbi:MAG: hypothetical protein K2O23_04365 [Anaeroplasmataceae bacterium]|nr:hypothetical protein [Anaeroplasmataceae bacterium]
MWWKEVIGICATVFILVSMVFPTLSYKGSFWMRILNLLGSVVFVVYGVLLPAISTAVLNGGLIIINAYHLGKLVINHKKSLKENEQVEQLEQNAE